MEYEVDSYKLEYIENENKYYISFKDSVEKECRIEINKEIFDEYIKSKKSYMRIDNETRRHIVADADLTEINLYKKSFNKPKSVEDIVIEKFIRDKVGIAKKRLTQVQRRRIELHIEKGFSLEDIARIEGVRKNKIDKSISLGIKKLKKFLKMGGQNSL